MRYYGTKLVGATIAGVFLGMIAGRTVGLGLRSDNVPFFILLGAVVGVIVGAAVGYAMEQRKGS